MIDHRRSEMEQLSIHYVGNNGNGEEMKLSEAPFEFKDERIKDLLMHYFLTPFKSGIYFHLKKTHHDIYGLIEDFFKYKTNMHSLSKRIASRLFDASVHPKIHGGEFYMAYFKDMVVDGELCDAIGIFKTETRENFLRISEGIDKFDVESDKGINLNKLDKGALIFNTEKEKGYKVSMIDTNSKSPMISLYWQEDFLHLVPREDSYFHTGHFIEAAKGFCEEVLTEENNVPRTQQMAILNKSINFLKGRDKFTMKEFETEVMPQPKVQKEFKKYLSEYVEATNIKAQEEFEVSKTAVDKNKKYLRGIIKLDHNFHIYVHGMHELLEKCFDEEKGMKYYKVYFENEE